MGRRTARRTPARAALSDLTEPEIADRLYASSRLTDKHTEIENLARHVFGSGQVASAAPQGITRRGPGIRLRTMYVRASSPTWPATEEHGGADRALSARRRKPLS
jgi:hypothetical protein